MRKKEAPAEGKEDRSQRISACCPKKASEKSARQGICCQAFQVMHRIFFHLSALLKLFGNDAPAGGDDDHIDSVSIVFYIQLAA